MIDIEEVAEVRFFGGEKLKPTAWGWSETNQTGTPDLVGNGPTGVQREVKNIAWVYTKSEARISQISYQFLGGFAGDLEPVGVPTNPLRPVWEETADWGTEGLVDKDDWDEDLEDEIDVLERFACGDCGFDTCHGEEYYVVRQYIWEVHGNDDGMLCIGCLERRLGRELTAADFSDSSVNTSKYRGAGASARLADRLARF